MRKLWTPSRRKLLLGGASLIASPAILRAQVPMTGAGKGNPGGTTPFALDGTVEAQSASATTLTTPGLTTTYGPNVVILLLVLYGGSGITGTPTISNSSFTFTSRASANFASLRWCYEYWGVSAGALSGQTFTANFASSIAMLSVFTISGAHNASPFDPSGVVTSNNAGKPTLVTTNANDIAYGCAADDGPSLTSAGSWTLLNSVPNGYGVGEITQYQSLSSTKAGLLFDYNTSIACRAAIVDAVIKGP